MSKKDKTPLHRVFTELGSLFLASVWLVFKLRFHWVRLQIYYRVLCWFACKFRVLFRYWELGLFCTELNFMLLFAVLRFRVLSSVFCSLFWVSLLRFWLVLSPLLAGFLFIFCKCVRMSSCFCFVLVDYWVCKSESWSSLNFSWVGVQ